MVLFSILNMDGLVNIKTLKSKEVIVMAKRLLSHMIVLMLLTALIPATTVTAQTNLLQNPGFEQNFTSWPEDWGNTAIVTNNYHSGSKAIRVGTGAGGRAQIIGGVSAGQSFTLKLWGKMSAAGQSAIAGVDCLNSSGNKISGG